MNDQDLAIVVPWWGWLVMVAMAASILAAGMTAFWFAWMVLG